jgi:hypothetical protein
MRQPSKLLKFQRGAAGPKAIVATLVLIALVYVGLQIIPMYYDHWTLQDKIKEDVDFAYVNLTGGEGTIQSKLNKLITSRLTAINAEFKKEQVKVTIPDGTKKITVEIWYTRTHKLPFYQNPKQFYYKYTSTTID